jgi:hypothetical protein
MLLFLIHDYQPNGPIKSKNVMWELSAYLEWTTTSMSPTKHDPKLGLFCVINAIVF